MPHRPWTSHYVQGTRTEIPPIPYKHLPDMFRYVASQFGPRTAFTQCMPNGMDASLTFAQTDRLSDAFAAYLRETLGLQAGDRVAVQLPNCLAYVVAAFGILKAGCILVNTNPLYTAPEMTHQFSDSGARALVILDMFADRLPAVVPATKVETVVLVSIAEMFAPLRRILIKTVLKHVRKEVPKPKVAHTTFSAAMKAGKAALKTAKVPHYVAHLELDDGAALQYTGGTTGVSKGALLTHRNLLANTMQLEEVSQHFLRTGEECVLTALPFYHIFAFTVNLLLFYAVGARDVMVPSPRPITALKKAWAKYPITWFTGVNTLYNALLNEEWFRSAPPKHLVASLAGGMALHSAVAARWKEVTGTPVVEGYGLTETSPVVTFNPIGGLVKDGTIGVPLPSTDLILVDEAGAPVAEGEPGELLVKGPQVMPGYWQRPDETAKVIDADGWLHTGDIAAMDSDGYVRIVDRKKDMILVSGFNVYPNEVEEVIAQLAEVAEVGVIGVPDERTGEAVKAVIVKKSAALTAEDVVRHCREQMTSYKVPKQVEFRAELPKSNVGKILRKDLRTAPPQEAKAAV
ncbi:AMP-binding protein [Longimicrobium sp.]|uniref:AMP-binding protein n=1 Tax=Longimicrobium sp. TaxID=2029185 RepID=UPI002BF35ABF|nr:AMP-binding protein [Longimicrobium sp.]HSU15248.1 AMP-binding protein [Longimicrobium sp.]